MLHDFLFKRVSYDESKSGTIITLKPDISGYMGLLGEKEVRKDLLS